MQGEPSGRSVTYVPYDPSLKRPDEGGTNGRPIGAQSLRESTQPSTAGVSKPAHSKSRTRVSIGTAPSLVCTPAKAVMCGFGLSR
jgi:hypothetical protein